MPRSSAGRINFKLIPKACIINESSKNTLSRGRAANIAQAHKQNLRRHILILSSFPLHQVACAPIGAENNALERFKPVAVDGCALKVKISGALEHLLFGFAHFSRDTLFVL